MDSSKLLDIIEKKFGDKILESSEGMADFIVVEPSALREISFFLRDDERMQFDFLRTLTGVDKIDWIESIFVLLSYTHKHTIMVKVELDKKKPSVDTVSDIWKAANWYEREMFDLFGINYNNHPDLRRLMMPDDWVGYPLRKDYKRPKKYNDIELYRFNPVLKVEEKKKKKKKPKKEKKVKPKVEEKKVDALSPDEKPKVEEKKVDALSPDEKPKVEQPKNSIFDQAKKIMDDQKETVKEDK